jgi:hypothetical protein
MRTDYKKKDKCRFCESRINLTIDHKHPVVLGGTDDKQNLQTLCYSCNKLKSGIPNETFKRIMEHGIYCFINKHKNTMEINEDESVCPRDYEDRTPDEVWKDRITMKEDKYKTIIDKKNSTVSHDTKDGYCCACEYDIAVFNQEKKELVEEIKNLKEQLDHEIEEANTLSEYLTDVVKDTGYQNWCKKNKKFK